jgi:hypothetical protein
MKVRASRFLSSPAHALMRETSLGSNASVIVLKKLTASGPRHTSCVVVPGLALWNGYDAFELGLVAPSDGIELGVVWLGQEANEEGVVKDWEGIHDVRAEDRLIGDQPRQVGSLRRPENSPR